MKINIIVAYSDNYVIGNDDKIPWNYNEDLKYFYKITTITENNKKNVVIMGYNTYKSLSFKLKNRVNIVITSKNLNNDIDTFEEDLYFVDSMGSSMELCQKLLINNIIEKIFIIGGEKIYKYYFTSYYYKFLDKVYITRIHKNYDGNKFFYGLEEKFYYLDIKKSINNPELEYRVLQYNSEFINPEIKYLTHLNKLMKIGSNNDKILNKEVLSFFEFNLDINLYQYFPLFSMIKKNKIIVLEKIFKCFKNEELKFSIEKIINKESYYINLIDIQPFNSIYYFNFHDDYLSCNVNHTKGNLLHDVLNNIIFSSLLVTFISKLLNLKPYIIKYNCINNYFFKSDISNIEKLILNTPDVQPLLNIIDNNQQNIEDFKISDLEFLGLEK